MKKFLIISFLVFIMLISYLNISYAAVGVAQENLTSTFKKLVFSDYLDSFSISGNTINITSNTENYTLNYNLANNPTFSFEVPIQKGMSFEDFEKQTQNLILPMYGYAAVANIQGIELEDAISYFLLSYIGNALTFEINNYVIVDDLNSPENFTPTGNRKIIYKSEFSNKVMEYVNDVYNEKQTISDSASINSYLLTIEKKDTTDTSCKLVSTLQVNLDSDFTKIKSYLDEKMPVRNITKENADYAITLKVGQKCKIEANAKFSSYTSYGKAELDISTDSNEITAKSVGTKGLILNIGNKEKTIFVTVEENTNNEKLDPIALNISITNQYIDAAQDALKDYQEQLKKEEEALKEYEEKLNPKNVLIIPPTKTRYNIGENLNLDGLKITAVYANNKIVEITKGYTVTGFNKNKAGIQSVTISYKGFSRSYNVNVGNVPTVTHDNADKLPQTGDFFDLKDGLYLLISILSICLVFIVYKSVRSEKNK